MSEMTYTKCELCHGTAVVRPTSNDDGTDEPHAVPCLCVRFATPGWVPTGVTLAQLERLADTERALKGDPGLDPKRAADIRERVHADLCRLRYITEEAPMKGAR